MCASALTSFSFYLTLSIAHCNSLIACGSVVTKDGGAFFFFLVLKSFCGHCSISSWSKWGSRLRMQSLITCLKANLPSSHVIARQWHFSSLMCANATEVSKKVKPIFFSSISWDQNTNSWNLIQHQMDIYWEIQPLLEVKYIVLLYVATYISCLYSKCLGTCGNGNTSR